MQKIWFRRAYREGKPTAESAFRKNVNYYQLERIVSTRVRTARSGSVVVALPFAIFADFVASFAVEPSSLG